MSQPRLFSRLFASHSSYISLISSSRLVSPSVNASCVSPSGDWLAFGCAALGQLLVWEWQVTLQRASPNPPPPPIQAPRPEIYMLFAYACARARACFMHVHAPHTPPAAYPHPLCTPPHRGNEETFLHYLHLIVMMYINQDQTVRAACAPMPHPYFPHPKTPTPGPSTPPHP